MTFMQIEPFFDQASSTYSYIVLDTQSKRAAVIDSVLDFDAKSGRSSTQSADAIIARLKVLGARLDWVLETHVHADHLSAAPYIQQQLGGKLGIGEHIVTVQNTFGKVFNAGSEFARDGSQFDHLFKDGDEFEIGGLKARAIHTPGHTPACMTYLVEDAAFVGDTLFMPDYGTARCDFPGGDARTLYQSIQKLFALPLDTKILMCHDYRPNDRAPKYMTTVLEQRQHNVHVHSGVGESEFVKMRTEKDRTLAMPTLILPAVQINMRAGHLPEPEDNGVRYLKIPLNMF
ncbi:MAG: MBL fold metallo-hydrolase [Limnobacter sp.]|nr:MBL fold metallo-hydrolase [Limnobacter sp.]